MATARVSRVGLVLFASVLATAGFTACSKSGGGGGPDTRIVYDFSTCDQKPDVGASAITGFASKTEWRDGYFAKPFDRYDLEAVLDASSTSTTEYVSSLGIGVFKIPRANLAKLCPTYFNLPVAPLTFQKVWSEVTAGHTGQGSLAGLFFEFCGEGAGAACHDRRVVQPTILLDEASDRWTIVHEMMHHNFNQGRKASPTTATSREIEQQGRAAGARLQNAMDAYQQAANQIDLLQASEASRELFEIAKQVAVRRMLEEMAIEAMLVDQWAAGDLKNVSEKAAQSAVWYMNYSREQFVPMLAQLKDVVKLVRSESVKNFWPIVTTHAEETQLQISAIETETSAMIDKAKAKIKAVKNIDDDRFLDAPIRWSSGPLASDGTGSGTKRGARPGRDAVGDAGRDEQAIAEAKRSAKAHIESHDRDGLGRAFDDIARDLGKIGL